jgi:urease accessory protein
MSTITVMRRRLARETLMKGWPLSTGHPSRIVRSGSLLIGSLTPAALLAHSTDAPLAGFASGALHPWAGPDHLMAMVLIGLWATQAGRSARWALPLLFVAVMTAGSTLAWLGLALAAVDQLTTLSVLAFGALVALQARLRPWITGALIAAAALVHGLAHGLEIPSHVAPLAFTAGLAVSTLTLHLGGVLIASALLKRDGVALLRASGATAAVAGAVMLAI